MLRKTLLKCGHSVPRAIEVQQTIPQGYLRVGPAWRQLAAFLERTHCRFILTELVQTKSGMIVSSFEQRHDGDQPRELSLRFLEAVGTQQYMRLGGTQIGDVAVFAV